MYLTFCVQILDWLHYYYHYNYSSYLPVSDTPNDKPTLHRLPLLCNPIYSRRKQMYDKNEDLYLGKFKLIVSVSYCRTTTILHREKIYHFLRCCQSTASTLTGKTDTILPTVILRCIGRSCRK